MKHFLLCSVLLLTLAMNSHAQAIDKSPVDISYYPVNYPSLKVQNKVSEPLVARVIYSRPKREGRVIFGQLVEYGKIWRLGANEATEIEFFKPVRINGQKVAKGRYTVYAIANAETWTIIINKETDTWGSFKYDAKKDVVRVDVPVQKTTEITESLGINFEKTTAGVSMNVMWDTVKVALPFTY